MPSSTYSFSIRGETDPLGKRRRRRKEVVVVHEDGDEDLDGGGGGGTGANAGNVVLVLAPLIEAQSRFM